MYSFSSPFGWIISNMGRMIPSKGQAKDSRNCWHIKKRPRPISTRSEKYSFHNREEK